MYSDYKLSNQNWWVVDIFNKSKTEKELFLQWIT